MRVEPAPSSIDTLKLRLRVISSGTFIRQLIVSDIEGYSKLEETEVAGLIFRILVIHRGY